MNKKILLTAGAALAVVAGVVGMAAYEAHVINVTAHIENALAVHPEAVTFGTVFPQEYLERQFTVAMSTSFEAAGRVDDVEYIIKQKPKCKSDTATDPADPDYYAPVGYATHVCPEGYTAMESLCPFLSKMTSDANDVSHPSYYTDPTPAEPNSGDEFCEQPVRDTGNVLNYNAARGWGGHSCPTGTYAVGGGTIGATQPITAEGIAEPGATIGGETYPAFPHYTFPADETGYVVQGGDIAQSLQIYVDCMAIVPDATGRLQKSDPADLSDLWIVDLKVPPVDGFVGQDWPGSCPTVPHNDIDYGCDLWIEVTNISLPSR